MTKGPIYIATSNAGKLRDFAAAARVNSVEVLPLPGFAELPSVVEDGATFEANARKKAEHYGRLFYRGLVLADDSGLEVRALGGAPGVHSARFAAEDAKVSGNASDESNNRKLLRLLAATNDRAARFVALIAVAIDGKTIATFSGEVAGSITRAARGDRGFGYDPLFEVENTGKTMAELSALEKAAISHRGRAFRRFLEWYGAQSSAFAKL
jgi:XTP/dITP diphosphohydrolase